MTSLRARAGGIAACLLAMALAGCESPPPPVEDGWSRGRLAVAEPGREGLSVAVRAGDTVYGLARQYGVPIRAIIDLNRLHPPYLLAAGSTLRLPRSDIHVVAPGDTLSAIARRYGTELSDLTRLNGIGAPYIIRPGQRIRLSGRAVAGERRSERENGGPATAKVIESPNRGRPVAVGAAAAPGRDARSAAVARPAPAPPPPRSGAGFAWPLRGEVVQRFGPAGKGRHNDGINIAVARGTAVSAAEDGVVVYAGNELRGYGNLLLIRHADGWMTAYAHNDALLAKRGDKVGRGQVIARAGSSGNVTVPQLHFEIRRNSRAVDPLAHLERMRALLTPAVAPGGPPGPG